MAHIERMALEVVKQGLSVLRQLITSKICIHEYSNKRRVQITIYLTIIVQIHKLFRKHIDNLINLNGNPSFNAVANTDKTRPDKHVSCEFFRPA